jgi:peptide/nickel transport system permease protein
VKRYAFVFRRILQTIPLLLGITLLVFALLKVTPGDPGRAILGVRASNSAVAQIDRQLGFDRPLPVQYLKYLDRTIHGNLGVSTQSQEQVTTIIRQSLPVTLWLIISGALLALLVTIPLAAVSAYRRGRTADNIVRGATLIGIGMPIYWVALMLLILVALPTGWFPVGGFGQTFSDHVRSIILPAVTLAIALSPVLIRSLRSSMVSVLESDYLNAARAIGLRGPALVWRHVVRNSIVPTVALFATQIGYMLFAAVILENAFDLPGLGQAMVSGAGARDVPVVLGITLIFAIMVVLTHLVADIVITTLDPRITV